jgi:predicted amino acid dehydrogenase
VKRDESYEHEKSGLNFLRVKAELSELTVGIPGVAGVIATEISRTLYKTEKTSVSVI